MFIVPINKLFFTTLLIIFSEPIAMAQGYKLIPLKNSEIKNNVKYHYLSGSKYTVSELYLFKNGSFRFESQTCLYGSFSTGNWTIKNEILQLKSDIQEKNIPVKLLYRSRDSSDNQIKRLAMPKDLTGKELKATIFINNDSTSCFYGDFFCYGNYSTIDSVKLDLNNGLKSTWIKVNAGAEIVQLVLQSSIDLTNYILYNATFKRNKNKLIGLDK